MIMLDLLKPGANPKKVLWPAIAQMPCMVCQSYPVTLHHCTGGSMAEVGMMRGTSQKMSDWLVIPLHRRYHLDEFGIDSGDVYWGVTDNWEATFGTQREMLTKLCIDLQVNLFRLAGFDYDNFFIENLQPLEPRQ